MTVNDGERHGKDYYYAVLNLHKAASQSEINERHRSLSLIFHPDKQQDVKAKEVATRTFLDIQKAYQVLSDPFLREVYDTFGEKGLSYKWDESIRSKSKEELRDIFKGVERRTRDKEWMERIQPRGQAICNIDASPLFATYEGSAADTLPVRLVNRMRGVQIGAYDMRHSVQKRLSDKTVAIFTTRTFGYQQSALNFTGTLRHQFSPRLSAKITSTLLAPHVFRLGADYEDDDNIISAKTSFAPFASNTSPSAAITFSRRLFPRRLVRGVLDLHIARQPQLLFNIYFPSPFSVGTSPVSGENALPGSEPPSITGFARGSFFRSIGIGFTSFLPKIISEMGIELTELALQAKIGVEWGFQGLLLMLSGTWSNQSAQITAATILTPAYVVLKLDVAYLEQRLSLPIVLSHHHSPIIALCTVIVPSTALVIGYHFILKPRRRAKRLAHIRAARRAHEEDSGVRRERDAVVTLLRDTARRHMHNETTKRGLIILEATYCPIEKDDRVSDLTQDVTIPVQALVRNSQLLIPGNQSKVRCS
ncbi:hypothetical protein AX14_001756 [Amanita brunnescens Koide BX004]|nr:hypothetical protein AX14_001756 [Amanita brunnescens Koide BX004]